MKDIKDLKMKDVNALNKLSADKLKEEVKDAEKRLFTLRMKLHLGELKQTHLVTFLRKYIARLKTVMNTK